jgi:hypothetical protein
MYPLLHGWRGMNDSAQAPGKGSLSSLSQRWVVLIVAMAGLWVCRVCFSPCRKYFSPKRGGLFWRGAGCKPAKSGNPAQCLSGSGRDALAGVSACLTLLDVPLFSTTTLASHGSGRIMLQGLTPLFSRTHQITHAPTRAAHHHCYIHSQSLLFLLPLMKTISFTFAGS